MGWKNWNYKVKGIIVAILLVILIGLVSLLSPEFLFFFYLPLLWITFPMFVLLGFFIGWLIDSIKRKGSTIFIGLGIGLIITVIVVFFMLYQCRVSSPGYPLKECFFVTNLIGNLGYMWIILSISLCTLIGWVVGKIKEKRANFKNL